MNPMYKSEAAEKVDMPEVCAITYKNKSVTAKLIVRNTYDVGNLEMWDSEAGVFLCLTPPEHNSSSLPKNRNLVRIDGDLYDTPINLGNDVFYFTEYWEGTIPDDYIGVPLKFSPAQELE